MKQQEMVSIPVHSVIDLITNSSTEIFVYSEKSLEPCKELINEILSLQGIDKKCDDLFDIKVVFDERGLDDYIENEKYEAKYNKKEFDEEKIKSEILEGNFPDWFEKYHVETVLQITPKEEKYNKLAKLLGKFLYSPDHEEHMWG